MMRWYKLWLLGSMFTYIASPTTAKECVNVTAIVEPSAVSLSQCSGESEVTSHVTVTAHGTAVLSILAGSTLDVVMVVDESGSIDNALYCPAKNCYEVEKNFTENLMAAIDSATNMFGNNGTAGYVEFSDIRYTGVAAHSYGTATDLQTYNERVSALTYSGGRTAIGWGISIGRGLLTGIDGWRNHSQVLVVITDGNENEGSDPSGEADKARADGVVVFAVGVTNQVSMTTLLGITGGDKSSAFHVNEFEQLDSELVDKILYSFVDGSCSSGVTLSFNVAEGLSDLPTNFNSSYGFAATRIVDGVTYVDWTMATAPFDKPARLEFDVNACTCNNVPTVMLHPAAGWTDEEENVVDVTEIELLQAGQPQASDNCGVKSVVQTEGPQVDESGEWIISPSMLGDVTVGYETTDLSGSSVTCDFLLTINDEREGGEPCPTAPSSSTGTPSPSSSPPTGPPHTLPVITLPPTPAPTPTPHGAGWQWHAVISGNIAIALDTCDGVDLDVEKEAYRAGVNAGFQVTNAVVTGISCMQRGAVSVNNGDDGNDGITSTPTSVSSTAGPTFSASTADKRQLQASTTTILSGSSTGSGNYVLAGTFDVDYYSDERSTAVQKATNGTVTYTLYTSFIAQADTIGYDFADVTVDQIAFSEFVDARTVNSDESQASGQEMPVTVNHDSDGNSTANWALFVVLLALLVLVTMIMLSLFVCCYRVHKERISAREQLLDLPLIGGYMCLCVEDRDAKFAREDGDEDDNGSGEDAVPPCKQRDRQSDYRDSDEWGEGDRGPANDDTGFTGSGAMTAPATATAAAAGRGLGSSFSGSGSSGGGRQTLQSGFSRKSSSRKGKGAVVEVDIPQRRPNSTGSVMGAAPGSPGAAFEYSSPLRGGGAKGAAAQVSWGSKGSEWSIGTEQEIRAAGEAARAENKVDIGGLDWNDAALEERGESNDIGHRTLSQLFSLTELERAGTSASTAGGS